MYFALRLLNPLSDVNNQLTSGVWHVILTKGQKNYLKTQTNNENTSEFNDERLMYVTIYKHKSDESKSHWFLSASEYTNSTEITFEQFKQYVLKENTMDKEKPVEKELIGYKLKQGYEQSEFKKLLHCPAFSFDDFETNGVANYTIFLSELTEMGVLDLWFEPVYKEQFQKGDWVIGECDGSIGTNTYIGVYDSELLMSEWADIRYDDDWASSTGRFTRIIRLATSEEIGMAKTYKYKAQIEAIVANAEAEIEKLLK